MSFGSAVRLTVAILVSVATIIYWPEDLQKQVLSARSFSLTAHLDDWNCVSTTSASKPSSAYDLVWTGQCSSLLLDRVEVEVIYLANQRGTRRLASPALDFVGNRLRSERVNLSLEGGRRLPVTQMVGQRSTGRSEALLYWYELEGSSLSNEYWLRLARLARALLGVGTSGLSVRISSEIIGDQEDSVIERQRNLARSLWKHLHAARILRSQL